MNKKTINLSLPEELLKKVDEAAAKEYSSRSDFVRFALLSKLQEKPSDENTVTNKKLLSTANSIIKQYKQDFINLANK